MNSRLFAALFALYSLNPVQAQNQQERFQKHLSDTSYEHVLLTHEVDRFISQLELFVHTPEMLYKNMKGRYKWDPDPKGAVFSRGERRIINSKGERLSRHYDFVARGFLGDCEDFADFAAWYLRRKGFKTKLIGINRPQVKGEDVKPGHSVCVIYNPDNTLTYFGNDQFVPNLRSIAEVGWTWRPDFCSVSEMWADSKAERRYKEKEIYKRPEGKIFNEFLDRFK